MIKVKLIKNNNHIKKIIIKGHAMYADYGKDIVCAAVSSTIITSINASLSIDNESLIYDDKNGLEIEVKKNDIVTTKIINNMINNLYELEKAYPKNIKIKEENNEIYNLIYNYLPTKKVNHLLVMEEIQLVED